MNESLLLTEFEKVCKENSWESWAKFEDDYFKELFDAPTKAHADFERQSRRKDLIINGDLWKPVGSSRTVDKQMEFWHWRLSSQIFAQLEPDAAAENAAHPERYDRWCVFCEICTSTRSLTTCPVCEHDLLDFPINEKTSE